MQIITQLDELHFKYGMQFSLENRRFFCSSLTTDSFLINPIETVSDWLPKLFASNFQLNLSGVKNTSYTHPKCVLLILERRRCGEIFSVRYQHILLTMWRKWILALGELRELKHQTEISIMVVQRNIANKICHFHSYFWCFCCCYCYCCCFIHQPV